MIARGRRVAGEIHAARGLGVMRRKLQEGEGGGRRRGHSMYRSWQLYRRA
jgi:hypothetical protein